MSELTKLTLKLVGAILGLISTIGLLGVSIYWALHNEFDQAGYCLLLILVSEVIQLRRPPKP